MILRRDLHPTFAARFAGLAILCCLVEIPSLVMAQHIKTENSAEVKMKVSPPRQGVQNEPVKIGISYTVSRDLGKGKLSVTYHNVDTGQSFVKTLNAPLTPGKHSDDAVWSSDETLPQGMYVVTVVLSDASGKELARYETNPENVQTLMITGGATRMLNVDQVKEDIKDLAKWRGELEKLVAAADVAGADTTRPKILIVVIKQMELFVKERLALKQYSILDINHQYLKKQVEKAKADLEKLAKDPNALPRDPAIPRPKERFTIRGSQFYAGDQPMFLSGPAFFNFTLRYMPVAAELGFNVLQVSTGPSSVFPTEDLTKTLPARASDYNEKTKTGEILGVLDEAEKLGMKVDLGLTSHFMPKWFYAKHPDAKNKFVLYGMMPYDIEDPDALNLIEKFYEKVMPQIANHPALNSIWIANEPEYMNPNERNIEIFRPWLEKKYKTIDALNKAWGTKLAGFDDIVAGGRKGHPVPDAVSTDGAMYDWWKYSTERLMHHWDWQKSLIRKYDKTVPIGVKLYNGTFNPQFKPMSRADEETSFDHMSYLGMDGGAYPFSKPYKDFVRSLDPDKPMADLEFKFGGVRTQMDFWQEAMQGCTDINWWCWHTKPAFSPVPSNAQSMHQAALDKLDIQRLLPQIIAFNKLPRAPMVFLYPDPVAGRYWEYFGYNDPTNRAVTELGFNCDYATEKRVAQGRLDEYQVLIMPAANFIRDDTYAKVKAFVEGGKTAIVLGAIPDQDEYGHPRDASFFKPHGQVKEFTFGDYKAVRFSAGKGTIYHLPQVPRSADGKNHLTAESAKLIEDFLSLALSEALPTQPVVIRDKDNRPFIENRTISYMNQAGEKTYLTYVVNESLDQEQVLQPKFSFKVKGCRDLIARETLDPKRIVIPSAGVLMLEFTVQQ